MLNIFKETEKNYILFLNIFLEYIKVKKYLLKLYITTVIFFIFHFKSKLTHRLYNERKRM